MATTPSARPPVPKKAAAAPAPATRPASKPATRPTAKVAPKAAAAVAPAPAAAPAKAAKPKLVRDSFTMPRADFDLIAELKERALGFKRPTKKSELLRAGLQALAGLNDKALAAALSRLAPLKPGRPAKSA